MSVEKQNGPEKQKRSKKKVIWISVLIILVMLAGIAGLVYVRPWDQPTTTTTDQTVTVKKGSLTIAATATGTTAIGSQTQSLNWTPGTTELIVEKVFVKAGSKVAQGDKLLKVTDDSLKTVQTELEKSVTNASVALEQAKITNEIDLVAAQSERDANVSLKTTAKMLYDETIASLDKTVLDAKTNLADAKTIISKNPSLITAKKKSIAIYETKLANANTALATAQAVYSEKKAAYEPIAKSYNEAKSAAEAARLTVKFATAYAADNGGVEALGPGFAGFLSAAEADWHAKEAIQAGAETGCHTAEHGRLHPWRQRRQRGHPHQPAANRIDCFRYRRPGRLCSRYLGCNDHVHNDMGNTIVMITHELDVAKAASRVVHIVDGVLHTS